jgi:hypothetical protein
VDVTDSDIDNRIIPYFEGVNSEMSVSNHLMSYDEQQRADAS